MIDGTVLSTAILSISTGLGGYVGGRLTGRSVATQVASDTVDMLQTQVDLLKEDKHHRDLEILDLNSRVAVLEGLVTQKAPVEEVKEVVDRIAEKVGA
jgi:FtsZ-binding cell division protein ZapB